MFTVEYLQGEAAHSMSSCVWVAAAVDVWNYSERRVNEEGGTCGSAAL